MIPISHLAVHGITVFFLLGFLGCAIVIPIVAYRFVSVLFDRDLQDGGQEEKPVA